jgi:hypothetical protein
VRTILASAGRGGRWTREVGRTVVLPPGALGKIHRQRANGSGPEIDNMQQRRREVSPLARGR